MAAPFPQTFAPTNTDWQQCVDRIESELNQCISPLSGQDVATCQQTFNASKEACDKYNISYS
ncbi:hypothetical protein EDD11_002038 [Mortierella claussenii]|nr:hypothetical protein EDD11_002038 [Mortierella claussenii]